MQRKIRQTRAQLQDTVQQLKDWHNVPGHIGQVRYDADSLVAEGMQQPGFQMPWLQLQTVATPLQNTQFDLQQRLARCDVEVAIIVREATDMVDFCKHRQGALRSALESRDMSSTSAAIGSATAGPGAAHSAAAASAHSASAHSAATHSAAEPPNSHASAQDHILRLQYVKGQRHVPTQNASFQAGPFQSRAFVGKFVRCFQTGIFFRTATVASIRQVHKQAWYS